MALGTGVHNLSLVVRANNRASRALASVGRDLTLLDKATKVMQTGFRTLSRVGILAMKALAVGVAVAIAGSVFAFSSFDDALTGSLAIVEQVSPEMRKSLQDTAREVAKTTIFSAKEAAAAYFNLFSAGQTLEQGMRSLPVVAQFAQAGLFGLERATELLVTAQNALGLTFEDPIENMKQMTRVADVLAAADERAVGSIEDFAEALTNRAAAAMRTFGIEVEEGVAVLAAWATQGLKGRTAGQAFSTVIRDLQRSALKNKDAFLEANVAVFDSTETFRNMADIVFDLEQAMEGLTDAGKKQLLQDLGFQERSQQRILQLLGTSEAIREFEAAFEQAGGTVQRVSDKQLQSAVKKLGLLKSAIIDVFIGSGQKFDEGFAGLIERLTEFVNNKGPAIIEKVGEIVISFGIFIDKAIALKDHFAGVLSDASFLATGLGGLNTNLMKLVGWIDKVILWWRKLSKPIKEAVGDFAKFLPLIPLVAGALTLVAFALAAIFSPATLVAVVIAGLIALFKFLWENSETFRMIISKVVEFFQNTVVPILKRAWEVIQVAADQFVTWFRVVAVPFLQQAWELILEAGAVFVSWLQDDAVPFIMEAWKEIQELFQAAWEFIVPLFEFAVNLLQLLWDVFGDTIVKVISVAWNFIKDIFVGAIRIIKGIFQVFTGILTLDWEKAWEGIKSILSGAWEIIFGIFAAAWGLIQAAFTLALDVLKTAWNVFWTILKGLATTGWNLFVGWIEGVWETFKTWWSDSWEGLKDAVGDILGTLGDVVKWPFNQVIGMVESLINTALIGLNNLISLINKIPGVSIPMLGTVTLPRLALGADVIREGLAIVGESGPELIRLGRGAQVAPLGSSGDALRAEVGLEPTIQIGQVIFQGTPESMLEDWQRHTKLALRGI